MTVLLAARLDDAERAAWLGALAAALPGERFVTRREELAPGESVDAAFAANPPAGALAGWPGLKLVQSLWAGVDKLLADPTIPPDLPIARMVDPAMNDAMARTALWAVLSLQRFTFDLARAQQAARWAPAPYRRADEVAVLVLGAGQMGGATASLLTATGFPVTTWRRGTDLAPLLARHDVVINLLPLTPQTRGLLDASAFAAMRRGAAVVNLARGAHVVDDDLLAALDAGQVGHAVLDVFHTEPLPPGHPYWRHPNVTVLPHVAAPTDPRSAATIAAAGVRAMRAGAPVPNLVDRARGY